MSEKDEFWLEVAEGLILIFLLTVTLAVIYIWY